MSRGPITAFALVALWSSGCLGASDAPLAAVPVGTAGALDELVFLGCSEQTAAIAVPADSVALYLPAGWSPQPFPGDSAGETGQVYVIFYECPYEAAGGQYPTATTLLLAVPAVPPSDVAAPDVVMYMVVLAHYATDPFLVEAFAKWGVPASKDATVRATLAFDGGRARVGQAFASTPDGELTLSTYAAGDDTILPGPPALLRLVMTEAAPLEADPGAVAGMLDLEYPAGSSYSAAGSIESTGAFIDLVNPAGTGRGAALAVHWFGDSYNLAFRPVDA